MTSSVLRWTTFGMFVAVLVAAIYMLWTNHSASQSLAATADAFDRRAASLTQSVMELRMAQQAYVAAGQGDEFWGSKVASQIATLREELGAVRALAASPEAQSQMDEALAALGDFERMDARAREYARGNQRLLASDLIFSDGLEKTTNILDALQGARTVEADGIDRVRRQARQRELLVAGGTAAAALVLGLMLVRMQRPAPAAHNRAQAEEPAPAAIEAPSQPNTLMLRDARDPLPPPGADTLPSLRELPPPTHDPFDLGEVASLCTELARIADNRSLPAVLERTASMLDANGVVLWIADPDGRELNPVVTHGYPPQIVTRLGTIPREAQNATAAAFRTALLQTVDADSVSNGAIAVPLLTPAGCVGVMAAEVRHGGEKQDAKLAAAAIVAAQLATLVGPPSARAQPRAEPARA